MQLSRLRDLINKQPAKALNVELVAEASVPDQVPILSMSDVVAMHQEIEAENKKREQVVPICYNCAYCRHVAPYVHEEDSTCVAPQNFSKDQFRSLVTGKLRPRYISCSRARQEPGGCDVEGKWYKPSTTTLYNQQQTATNLKKVTLDDI